ncbi:MAG: bifunctional diaminohydroxyphosphoribosylaminopyrimidine deaminase/5-amino-6-(5-phosphoribosylamino)uracil reductase RibD [Cryobacterium sp.]|uniref:bifunctional diaminohydroxyphosphoribosylaminopyrimidine deaminase/5-amino-6-(5-phosphoribosylamino)uracil reductase RibD n=1 Tax=unclassified Cryobacterium TaxID=2649013 RepID=UPI001A2E37C6|nr:MULTISPECIES: bifunctional diaminohydroxyphosphoribosylaminopyrimidine deaminase/5-amino-6-(5-phosphoribosylamino)uracil reductase RibD [unclassified Cryobacterium]MCY7404812.1 bifunctional diaminohydroxyphosphoribosylaminopyrimidine deaminase/5-amino-6-(5-phosphoribosylamino)uracil reductase RibD [Cryobacterium sp.]MEC5153581.1 diaminohydroxyphosphoribosylaminopyrimidine deaminase/5-amino-6-(5-phosphoribosylamino)uracil reductase [Cryobacterium sp. CAN_C3]
MTTNADLDTGVQGPALHSAMRRALELAARGPATGVNPRVGCVILNTAGDSLAEGWHRGAGTAHAEVDALSKLDPGAARGGTAVVTLEPCNHIGRTGPCVVALIEAGVTRVVYSVTDPGEHSCGGAARLRGAGIEVQGGVLADEGEAFLGDWLVAARLSRPFVTLKSASSLDGRAAAADGSSRWITGAAARLDVHRRRAACDTILVGTGTVLTDDPALTARRADGGLLTRQPVPVVVGRRELPASAALFAHPQKPLFFDGLDLPGLLADLHGRGLRSVFIEGGPTVASAFVAAGLVDEYLIYLAPTLIGGPRVALEDIGVTAIGEQRRLSFQSLDRLGDDVLIVARPLTI